jgi:hypothetical protein
MKKTQLGIFAGIRYLTLLTICVFGLIAIIGSGDNKSSSSSEYETIETTFDFDQIYVDYDANNPTPNTEVCISTTMLDEAIDAGLPDAENIRVIGSSIDLLVVGYDARWTDVGALQTIICQSSVKGDWEGPIDAQTLQYGDSGWDNANDVTSDTRTAFQNYLTNYDTEYQLCVSCNTDNLFNSYTLDYLISMDVTLTVAYDNVEETNTE